MARDPTRLYGPAQLGNSATTVYTVPAATKTIIRNIHLMNPPGGSNRTVTISIGSDAAGTRVYREYPVATGQTVPIWTYFVLTAGEVLQAYADGASAVVITIDGDEIAWGGAGGAPILYQKAIAFNTPHISDGTGATIWTPAVGDVLYDMWIQVDTAWNGTTPKGDIGTATGGGAITGFGDPFGHWYMDLAYSDDGEGGAGFSSGYNNGAVGALQGYLSANSNGGGGSTTLPAVAVATNPLKVWVSQTGRLDGASPGSSQGAGTVFLLTFPGGGSIL